MERQDSHRPIGDRAPEYGFFQLVRLLSSRRPQRGRPGYTTDYAREAVRVRPDPAHVFPASDVKRVDNEDAEGEPVTVTVTFGGLYGIDSPIPFGFHERISSRPDATGPLREFLDMFSNRLYGLLWRSWARYRPDLFDRATPERKTHDGRVASLVGVATPGGVRPPVDEQILLALAGRLSSWSRNSQGLKNLLELSLGREVVIHENVMRRVKLPHRPRIGASRLGIDTVVGNAVRDASGKFRIQIGPLSMDEYLDFLPERDGARRVDALVRLYAPDYLDYDLLLVLNSDEVAPLRLGETRSAQLGLTACVGRPRTPQLNRTVRYAA